VKAADGSVAVGADAFAVLFERTRGQRAIGRLLRQPVARKAARLGYNLFARLLYKWNRAQGHW
jgi:predicted DCC family thiol-disulfide oxidoreductase YuxK